MITSKLTSKSQTTIPQSVRSALHLKPGDDLVYIVDGDSVVLKKATPPLQDDPFATFDEWNSEADQRAYGDL